METSPNTADRTRFNAETNICQRHLRIIFDVSGIKDGDREDHGGNNQRSTAVPQDALLAAGLAPQEILCESI